MPRRISILFAALTVLGTAAPLCGQSNQRSGDLYHLSLGGSTSTLGNFVHGFGFLGELGYQRDNTTYALRFSGNTSDYQLFELAEISILEIGALMGRAHSSDLTRFSYAGGIAAIMAETRGAPRSGGWFSPSYEAVDVWSVALIGEASYVLTPFDFLGIGAFAHASLNTRRSYFDVGLMLQVGKIK